MSPKRGNKMLKNSSNIFKNIEVPEPQVMQVVPNPDYCSPLSDDYEMDLYCFFRRPLGCFIYEPRYPLAPRPTDVDFIPGVWMPLPFAPVEMSIIGNSDLGRFALRVYNHDQLLLHHFITPTLKVGENDHKISYLSEDGNPTIFDLGYVFLNSEDAVYFRIALRIAQKKKFSNSQALHCMDLVIHPCYIGRGTVSTQNANPIFDILHNLYDNMKVDETKIEGEIEREQKERGKEQEVVIADLNKNLPVQLKKNLENFQIEKPSLGKLSVKSNATLAPSLKLNKRKPQPAAMAKKFREQMEIQRQRLERDKQKQQMKKKKRRLKNPPNSERVTTGNKDSKEPPIENVKMDNAEMAAVNKALLENIAKARKETLRLRAKVMISDQGVLDLEKRVKEVFEKDQKLSDEHKELEKNIQEATEELAELELEKLELQTPEEKDILKDNKELTGQLDLSRKDVKEIQDALLAIKIKLASTRAVLQRIGERRAVANANPDENANIPVRY